MAEFAGAGGCRHDPEIAALRPLGRLARLKRSEAGRVAFRSLSLADEARHRFPSASRVPRSVTPVEYGVSEVSRAGSSPTLTYFELSTSVRSAVYNLTRLIAVKCVTWTIN